ncbi:MAG: hypothetical protein DME40_20015 [Verrucomicrobia bacterium]|nr:MAG: hypothetical protein DME40_20015 [Verrucomicrobiota bacterium]
MAKLGAPVVVSTWNAHPVESPNPWDFSKIAARESDWFLIPFIQKSAVNWVLWIQIIVVRNNSTIAIATEAKGLPNFSSGKPSTVLERAVAAAPDIVCIPISGPPADNIWRRRSACLRQSIVGG